MLKKTMTYEDYNGVPRTEDFYFNLTPAEVTETPPRPFWCGFPRRRPG